MINTIARITNSKSRKNSAHPITANISINDFLVTGAVKIPSMNKSHRLLNQFIFGILGGVVETACRKGLVDV